MARDSTQKTQKKEARRVKILTEQTVTGKIKLQPNPEFRCRDCYKCEGLGYLFSGNYYFNSVTHTINGSGYSVEADTKNVDMIMIQKITGNGGQQPAETPPATNPDTGSSSKSYTVASGDCLSSIASRYGTTWEKIYELNRDTIGDNPNLIYPNQSLVLP